MQPLKSYFKRIMGKLPRGTVGVSPSVTHQTVKAAFEFDPSPLDVITWSPVHMARSERLLLFTMAYSLRPERYLEIGTLHGGSALIVSAALDALNLSSRMVCLDPEPRIAAEHWQMLEHRATLLKGYSPQDLPRARDAAGGAFDLVLIDGDHSYAGVTRDADGVLPFVQENAYLLFHDCFYPEVEEGINDFVGRNPGRIVDFGPLTRESSILGDSKGQPVNWGGIRVVRVSGGRGRGGKQ